MNINTMNVLVSLDVSYGLDDPQHLSDYSPDYIITDANIRPQNSKRHDFIYLA